MYKEYEGMRRIDLKFPPNTNRVILRRYNLHPHTITRIGQHIAALPEEEIDLIFDDLVVEFKSRHRDLISHLDSIIPVLTDAFPLAVGFSKKRQQVLSSYFSSEYSIEGAALFNPSIVLHPTQSHTGANKFIMSLRGAGEGHISSVEFREGHIYNDGRISLIDQSGLAELPIRQIVQPGHTEIAFHEETSLCERVIFPVTDDERNGIEDLRLVRFEDGNDVMYYGTFTAYDGQNILSKILRTRDFRHFDILKLTGAAVRDKGMALFPRKINGRYMMISRQDGENLRIMSSENLYEWQSSDVIRQPHRYWELVKSGNCGSPLETDAGWLLLTHGVGPLRKYVIGACLLDLENPDRIIATLPVPLLAPTAAEREGYVPNVLYTCGGIIVNGRLILPYAMSDAMTGFALTDVKELINSMETIR